MATTTMSLPPLDAAQQITVPSELDAVRSKLVQLIDALSTLVAQLHYAQITATPEPSTLNPGILPYSDLLSRYNILLSHVVSLSSLLSSAADARLTSALKPQDRGRDPRKEKWQGSVVVPAVAVEEQRDWLVGVLLRTKQTPDVEQWIETLVKELPTEFAEAALDDPGQKGWNEAVERRARFTKAAADRIQLLKRGVGDEEWDWKGRVEVEDEDEDENEDEDDAGAGDADGDVSMAQVAKPPPADAPRKWTLQEIAAYYKTGKVPS